MRNQLLFAAGTIFAASPATAANVSFSGIVANLCVLTVSTPGALGLDTNGTMLSSEETGGIDSVVAIASTGTNPTITFSAPQLTGPSGSLSGTTKEMRFTSLGGANQAWTTGAATYTANRLIDTVTIKARASNSAGFVTGSYAINTTATCQQ